MSETAVITKPQIKPTRERLYLEHILFHGPGTVRRHVNRYKWAAGHLLKGDSVLDSACGSGYGDYILMGVAREVVGIDRDADAIHYAKWKRQTQNQSRLSYFQMDLAHLEGVFQPNEFDAIVCIETIEHLDETGQHDFVRQAVRLLKPGGRFIVTTPEKGDAKMTEFHEREFTRTDFIGFLSRYFKDVSFDTPAQFGVPHNFLLAVCREPHEIH